MSRKSKNGGIKQTTAFDNVFTFTKTTIPQPIEDKLLDAFTNFSEYKGIDDILISQLPELFVKYLHISPKLAYFIKSEQFVLEGTTDIVDFEKYLFNGYLFLTLNKGIKTLDFYWNLVVPESPSNEPAYKRKLYMNDIKKLTEIIGDTNEVSSDLLIDMLTVPNSGEDKLYVDYFDFGLILGRIGELVGY
ncbi:unnamed protein product [Ambrosiozyma monospora]|uniref:Unnamed protein product n=1 Tax=Ambrosiozyma monospora TaxID=43982 RepID=A0ACB5TCY9_AMBMO|nr:unnamed protein product [Ambrosiozyma monospora]